MLIHTILIVPRDHMNARYDGAILSFLIGPAIGGVLVYAYTRSLSKFKGKGLPEIAAERLPKALSLPLVLGAGLMSFIAGGMAWIHCAFIISKYLNPDMSPYALLILFVIVTCAGAVQTSKTVLFSTEIIYIVCVPLLVVLLIHGLFSKSMNYDSVKVMLDYTWVMPSWSSLSAATNTFAGYMALSVFNRTFPADKQIKHLWLIPAVGLILELFSFFIPIGFHGTDGVDDYIYTWVSTVDAFRMKYLLIERVVSIYLLILLVVTYVFTMITWHVGAELVTGAFRIRPPKKASLRTQLPRLAVCVLIGIGTVIAGARFDETTLFKASSFWMGIRMPLDVLIVFAVVLLSRWRLKA
ncbi:GerAB/ArcD/ProY family transporter [Paenibacillus sp. T1]|uniref:GerAB/ArcD/ProY family transporter n=2 Tax=Paenibacillus glycinis TaxID=2697035 RepID=A0ABW9XKI0_9BACL|nr:GerAB/ArcD/ProY family transporter [Paenibacillus glycinis]